jgi:Leucine-rich repeat (LRR) protein
MSLIHRVMLLLAVGVVGCGKREEPAVVVVDVPTTSKKEAEPTKVEPKKQPPKQEERRVALVPLDLRPYGLYAEINAPVGTAILQTVAGEIILNGADGYSLSIKPGTADIGRFKKDMQLEPEARWLIQEPDAALGQWKEDDVVRHRFAINLTLAGKPYQITRTAEPTVTEAQARRNFLAARGINQTPVLVKAAIAHDAAIDLLKKRGLSIEPLADGSSQLVGLGSLLLTDEDLLAARLLPELSQVFLQVNAPLTVDAIRALENLPRLRHLRLGGAWVDRTVIRQIGTWGQLRSVRVASAPLRDADLAPLAALTNLERLELLDVRLTDAGLKAFEKCVGLKWLLLNGTDVGDGSIALINGFKELRELGLADTSLTDAGLAELKLPDLRRLDVSETLVSDESLAMLALSGRLNTIDVAGTRATAAGLASLRKAILGLQLERPWPIEEPAPAEVRPPVAIAESPPADPGAFVSRLRAKVVRDDEALGKPIVELDCRGTKVADRDLADLRDLATLRRLDLENAVGVSDAGLAYLANATALEELNLLGTRTLGDGLAHLKNLTKLKKLTLPVGVTLTARQLAPIAGLPALEHLSFEFPAHDDAVFALVRGMTALKELSLDTATLSNRKLIMLSGLKNLESLSLGKLGGYSDRGLAIVGQMPRLKTLLVRHYQGSNGGLEPLRALAELEHLTLDGPFITDAGLEFLPALAELKTLRLDNLRVGDRTAARLPALGKLIHLSLRGTETSDRGLAELGKIDDLETIDLGFTRVTDAGLKSLQKLEELRALTLDGLAISGVGLKSLEDLPRLHRVSLALTPVTDEGLRAVASVSSLMALDLSGTEVAAAQVALLKPLPRLREMRLAACQKLREDLLPTVMAFKALKEIDLGGTKISKAAVDDMRRAGITVVGIWQNP